MIGLEQSINVKEEKNDSYNIRHPKPTKPLKEVLGETNEQAKIRDRSCIERNLRIIRTNRRLQMINTRLPLMSRQTLETLTPPLRRHPKSGVTSY